MWYIKKYKENFEQMNRKQKETKLLHAVRRSIITTIFLIIIIFLINIAPNYLKEAKDDRVNIIINNNKIKYITYITIFLFPFQEGERYTAVFIIFKSAGRAAYAS